MQISIISGAEWPSKQSSNTSGWFVSGTLQRAGLRPSAQKYRIPAAATSLLASLPPSSPPLWAHSKSSARHKHPRGSHHHCTARHKTLDCAVVPSTGAPMGIGRTGGHGCRAKSQCRDNWMVLVAGSGSHPGRTGCSHRCCRHCGTNCKQANTVFMHACM